ncbi:MAG: nitrogen regulation protein NR(I) [Nitrospirae bacterium RBG_16_64_22]|nr:MAG: nitrogen regulation protein NR(I) [Nitrospirae bacterium RBG_16_64_22]
MTTLAPRVLVVDDDESICWVLSKALDKAGFAVTVAHSGPEALERLALEPPSIVLMDIRMPGMSGLDALEKIRAERRDVQVIIMTAQSTMTHAIEAMKRGAYDYLTKPFDTDQVTALVARAAGEIGLPPPAEEAAAEKSEVTPIVGRSGQMQEVFKAVGRVAGKDVTVLLRGESGTGKELVAQVIHANSRRLSGPFVTVNAAAIPRDLLESELFGHEKGAFTGAAVQKRGKFEVAHGGTIFLDEIGDMDLSLQAKILRVLQEKTFERVGGTDTIKVDVRVIAATHQNIEELVAGRRFREDLYYRLNVFPIFLPPLRERMEDLPLLVSRFVDAFRHELGTGRMHVSPRAMELLKGYDWPGNVRELENTIKRAMILSTTGTILPDALPDHLRGLARRQRVAKDESLERFLEEKLGTFVRQMRYVEGSDLYHMVVSKVERTLIAMALRATGGNQIKAAETLGINRNTLRKKIKDLRIPVEKGKAEA